ncbi:MAG: ABC transporter permease [Tannerellaceae bacterium]
MMTLFYLLEKEFKQIRRDRFMPKIIFLVPVIQLILLPFAANFEMHNINLSVVDGDHSATSRRLIEQVTASGYFRLTDRSATYEEALASIENDAADLILEIPHNYEEQLGREGHAEVLIASNAVNGTKGGLASSYLSNILLQFSPVSVSAGGMMCAKVEATNLFNPHLNYKSYMVPGIMVFLLTIIGGFLSALNVVSEKEKGTIEQINVSPVPKSLFLLSKLIPFWMIGFELLTIGALIAWAVYGLLPVGSFGVIYLFAAVYLIAFTGFGLAISSISSTQQQAMFTVFFFFIIFILMSGLFTPISSMPEWAQRLTFLNPIRYAVEVMRMVYLKGSGFADLLGHFGAVCLFAVFFNVLAVVGYRKN